MKKNKIIIIGIILIALILLICIINGNKDKKENNLNNEVKENFSKTLNDGTKLNTSDKLKEKRKIGDLEVGKIQITNKDGKSVLLAEVTNKGKRQTEITVISIELYNANEEKIDTIAGIINPLNPGESTQLNTTTQEDYSNIYDVKIQKVK